ncbi:tyrosine-type recombinase/integrase [Glycomyces tarimensis]
MNTSYDVVIYKLRKVERAKERPYNVRWRVGKGTTPHSKYYAKKPLAQSFEADLRAAMNRGEAFDLTSGLPLSMVRAEEARNQPTWLEHARDYAAYKWDRSRGNSREGTAAMLVDITMAVLPDTTETKRDALRVALRHWTFKKRSAEAATPAEEARLLDWANEKCPKAGVVAEPAELRRVLDRLMRNLDGTPAAPSTFQRRKVTLHAVFEYAITQGIVETNPLDSPALRWEKPRKLKVVKAIKPQQIGNTEQVEHLLTAVGYVGAGQGWRFVAFFGSMYYAMMRPEEVIALGIDQCQLPREGWGKLVLEAAEPDVGKDWTDSGERHEIQELKHRGVGETRPVPIPPRLVELLRHHIDSYGVGPDGRLFRSVNRNPIQSSTYLNVMRHARQFAYGPTERASAHLKRPYDLRHSGIVLRLYAGVPVKQVALWAGHSVQVLLDKYANVMEGFDEHWHQKIDEVMRMKPE